MIAYCVLGTDCYGDVTGRGSLNIPSEVMLSIWLVSAIKVRIRQKAFSMDCVIEGRCQRFLKKCHVINWSIWLSDRDSVCFIE